MLLYFSQWGKTFPPKKSADFLPRPDGSAFLKSRSMARFIDDACVWLPARGATETRGTPTQQNI